MTKDSSESSSKMDSPSDYPEPIRAGAPWAFIAVMGVTGAGKSTFIREVSGDESVVVGNGLKSCTSELKGYCFYYGGYNINLVDSPGFNDTYKSETEVLQDISRWLQETYEQDEKLTGIIYLHGINQPRISGPALQNLKMFRELCGPDPLKNVILATTFWNNVTEEVGAGREDELASEKDFWAGMLKRGSRMERYTDRESGLKIVKSLMQHKPEALKIQRELVEDGKKLIDTGAGQIVNEELARLEKVHLAKIEEMHSQMEEALKQRDVELQEVLEDQGRQLEDEISRVHRQQEQLKADRRAETRRLENSFNNSLFELQSRNEELLKDLENLQGDAQRRQHERALQDQRLRELERYNEEARKKWEGLDIDAVIAKVRAEESKLRVEEREKLEAEIQKLRKNEQLTAKNRKRDTAVNIFFGVLRVALPLASMFTLGIPITLPWLPSASGGGGGG